MDNLFKQAEADPHSIRYEFGDCVSYGRWGLRITKSPKGISIVSVCSGGNMYRKLTPEQLQTIIENGWAAGGARIGIAITAGKITRLQSALRCTGSERGKQKIESEIEYNLKRIQKFKRHERDF